MFRWACLLLCAAPLFAQPAGVSFANEAAVDAPLADVWKVFSTPEGYKALGPALVDMDFRVGGVIRSRYSADGTLSDDGAIENAILAYEPPTMLAIRIRKPPANFPFRQAWKQPWTVITLRELTPTRTLVRIASLGYAEDEESKAMRRFFESGNQQTLEALQKHFAGSGAH